MTNALKSELKQNYEGYYADDIYEWRQLGAIDKVQNIIALCKNYPHRTILEIGAGEGAILQQLSELNFGEELYALEISSTGVDAIKNRQISALVECKLFDGYNIPYADKAFDLVILSHVIEHVEHPRTLLYEASRVSNYTFIEVPLEDNFGLPNDFIFDRVGHINFYSAKTIRQLTQTCDIAVIEQIMTTSSRKIYEYQSGKKGLFKHAIKSAALQIAPSIASSIWTYNASLLCRNSS